MSGILTSICCTHFYALETVMDLLVQRNTSSGLEISPPFPYEHSKIVILQLDIIGY